MDLRAPHRFGLGRIVLLAAVAIVAVVLYTLVKSFVLPNVKTHTSIEPGRLKTQLVAQQTLQVYDLQLYDLRIDQSEAPDGFLGTVWHTDTVLHAYGDVEVTVDVSKAKVSSRTAGGSVTIFLPDPQIQPARVDHKRTTTERPRCGINVILGCHPKLDAMNRAAQSAMQHEAADPKYDIMNKSRRQAEVVVRNLVTTAGGDPAKLKFTWVANPA
jgi:Protein of unknown function (DUF4230)